MATVLEQVRERKTQALAKAKEKYREAVRAVADGIDPGKTLDRVMQDLGKTVADLDADVKLLLKRRQLLATGEQLPGIRDELRTVSAEREDAKQKAEKYRQDWLVREEALRLQEARLLARESNAQMAMRQLNETANDPDLAAEENALMERAGQIMAKRRFSERGLHGTEGPLADHERNVLKASKIGPEEEASARQAHEYYIAHRIKPHKDAIAQCDLELAEVNVLRDELQLKRLVP